MSIETIDYIERVRAIKRAAKNRFGDSWEKMEFAQAKESTHPQFLADDPLSWRFNMRKDGVSSSCLFNLRTDCTEEAIERTFRAMEVSREELLGTFR